MKSNVGGAFNKYTTQIRNRNKMKKDTAVMKTNQKVVIVVQLQRKSY